jgi:hypothetical protein
MEPYNLRSPWLDPVFHAGYITTNYGANNDACNNGQGETLQGGVDWAGSTFEDLTYNEWYAIFPKSFEFSNWELAEPDPDINVNDQIATDYSSLGITGSPNWFEHMEKNDLFSFPFSLPDKHWYEDRRKLYVLYSLFLNLNLNDVELYKIQRPRESGMASIQQNQQDKGRY